MTWLRPIDLWFSQQVLPHESHYLRQARRWTRNADEAADLVQEAYLKLLQCENWRGIRDPRSYATMTIRNLVLQRVRRARVVAIEDIPALDMSELRDDSPGVFDIVAGRDALRRLQRDVERLAPVCRKVIRMRKFEDLPPREIARRLGIALSTVETHLTRGMHQLMQMQRSFQLSHASQDTAEESVEGKVENRVSR